MLNQHPPIPTHHNSSTVPVRSGHQDRSGASVLHRGRTGEERRTPNTFAGSNRRCCLIVVLLAYSMGTKEDLYLSWNHGPTWMAPRSFGFPTWSLTLRHSHRSRNALAGAQRGTGGAFRCAGVAPGALRGDEGRGMSRGDCRCFSAWRSRVGRGTWGMGKQVQAGRVMELVEKR